MIVIIHITLYIRYFVALNLSEVLTKIWDITLTVNTMVISYLPEGVCHVYSSNDNVTQISPTTVRHSGMIVGAPHSG